MGGPPAGPLAHRYRLDEVIGQGGMGTVYRAHDTLLDRDVAVKVLSNSALGTEGRSRLLHEARAAAQLNHPNIVAIYDAGETDGEGTPPFIVMELVAGESLHARRPAALDEIVEVARQVCAALAHAHAHGIIHRDLKPENILLVREVDPGAPAEQGPAVRAKLMDFGVARSAARRITTEGALVGTVFYLAPEQALGQTLDGRTDLYALGVMLYELTTGRLPFTGDDPLAVISQHLYAPVVPPRAYAETLPPALEALILRLLSKQAEDRPGSAAEVLSALEQLASPETAAVPGGEISLLDRIMRGQLVGRKRELTEARRCWGLAGPGGAYQPRLREQPLRCGHLWRAPGPAGVQRARTVGKVCISRAPVRV